MSYSYDIFGNKVSMTTYRDFAAAYTNWGCGIPSAPSGDTTRWLYDEDSNCMTNKVYADGNGTKYEYDAHGRLTKRTWARGIDTTYTYDAWGRLTRTDYSDSTPSVVLCYDVMGRQTRAVDAAGITTFAYDSFGSLTNETVVGVAGTNTIERFYDAFGRDAGYALNGVRQSTLGYDAATGRLASMQIPSIEEFNHHSPTPTLNSNFFTWSYLDGSDLKSSLTYPNGLTASWTYGNRGELLEVNNASPTGTISKYAYTYDDAGRRVACAKSGTAFERSDSVNYGYNARSELTSATAAVDSAYRYGYNFDDIGNRKRSAERGVWSSEYTANNLNQYTTITSQTARASEAFRNYYDADGNQTLVKTATGIWQVTYNGENRPVLWAQGTNTISMSFDRMGRRVTKNAQRFVYNGYLQIANHHSSTSTSHFNYYIWDPTEPIATRPLAWTTPTTDHESPITRFYTHDGNKNVSEVIASDDTLAAHYEYAPFGALTVSRGASAAANPFRFSSEYAEDDMATVYYNYRHYEPMLGRWLQRDPIREVGGLGLFCYLGNMVGARIDILGLAAKDAACNKENVGAVRAQISDFGFSIAGQDAEELDELLKTIISLLILYDIPIPGAADVSSIGLSDLNTILDKYPSGADVSAEMLKNYRKLKDMFLGANNVDAWVKVKCQECECGNKFKSFLGIASPSYDWITFDESDWIKCDIKNTSWGRKNSRGIASKVRDGSIVYYLLTPADKKAIREQCGSQAGKYCDMYK